MEFLENICRICKAREDEFFISIHKKLLDGQKISDLIKIICEIEVPAQGETDILPKDICTKCLNCLLTAKKLKRTAHESEKFFREIILKSEVEYVENCQDFVENCQDYVETYQDSDEIVQDHVEEDFQVPLKQEIEEVPLKEEVVEYEYPEMSFTPEVIEEEETESLVTHENFEEDTANNKCEVTVVSRMDITINSQKPKILQKEWFRCPHFTEHIPCRTPFNTPEDLDIHMKEKHGPPLTCENCKRIFRKVLALNNHVQSKVCYPHEDVPVVCKVCGLVFKNRNAVFSHERKKHRPHLKSIRYSCDLCGNSYAEKAGVKQHISIFHLKNFKFSCKYCSKKFYKNCDLQVHLHSVHLSDLRMWKCSTCPKTFAAKYALVKHQVVHTGERKFQCEYCNKNYAYLTDYRRHLQNHTGQYSYRCEICKKGFNKKSTLTAHQNVHKKR